LTQEKIKPNASKKTHQSESFLSTGTEW